MTSLIIPTNVVLIGDSAFFNCSGLTAILFLGESPLIWGTAFGQTPATFYYKPAFSNSWQSPFGGNTTVCWNPTIQQDTAFGFTSDCFGFNITGTTNIPIVVEATTNLSYGVWTPLTNASLGISGSFYFADPAATNKTSGFYRIVWP